MLRDLLLDANATVVSNAVAALSEIGDRQDGVIFKLNLTIANRLLHALGESSEYVLVLLGVTCLRLTHCIDGGRYTYWTHYFATSPTSTPTQK